MADKATPADLIATAAQGTGATVDAAYKGVAAMLGAVLGLVEEVANIADVPIDLSQKTIHEAIDACQEVVARQS